MPLSGSIDLGGRNVSVPTWAWFIKGLDNNHYGITGTTGEGVTGVTVFQAEGLSVTLAQTEADWRTDLNALNPSGYDANPNNWTCVGTGWPIVGTNKFIVPGYNNSGLKLAFITYAIDGSGVVAASAASVLTDDVGIMFWLWGANVIGSYMYWVVRCTTGGTLNGLLRFPTSGVPSSGNISTYFTRFSAGANADYFEFSTGRRYDSRAAILPDSAGIRVFSYLGFKDIPVTGSTLSTAGSEAWVINPSTNTVVSGPASMQAAFGQPWADSGTLYAGTASALVDDDYGAPIVNSVSGGWEIIFGRGFSDSSTVRRFRRYFMDGTTYAISYIDTFEVTLISDGWAKSMAFASRDGGDLLIAGTNEEVWDFTQVTLAAPTATVTRYYVERLTQVFDDNVPDAQHFTVDSGIVPPSAKLATSGSDGFNGIRCYGMDLLTVSGATTLAGVLGGMDIGNSFNAVLGVVDFHFSGNFTLAYVQSFGTKTFPEVSLDQYQVAIDSGTVDGSSNRLYHVIPFMVGFPYTSQAQLLRPNHGEDAGTKDGPAMGKIRRNHKYAALLYRTQGDLKFGTDFGTTLHPAPLSQPNGAAIAQPTLFSGTIRDTIADDYSTDGMIAFQQTRPGPGTIISIAGHIETQDE